MGGSDKKIKAGIGNGCAVYKKCGGCQLQNMTYDEQLHCKMGKLIALLGKYGHVSEIVPMENPVHYRCKVQAAFGQGRTGIISGVYQSSTHKIVPIDRCMIEDETADRIVVTVRTLMESFRLKPFNENTMSGFLRHVLVRRGYYSGQVMLVLVTGSAEFPSRRAFLAELLRLHPEITTVVQNINANFTSLVLGDRSIVLYGEGYIEDTLLGTRFRISPKSFYQVNPQMTELLYAKAIGLLSLTGKERVIDAYCGTGTIGILAARSAGQVIGVELNGDAVRDAIDNAARNDIRNITFVKADASDFLVEMAQEGEKADALIMDPPRAGSDVRFMSSAVKMGPRNIVYVSCNPETLARDLRWLTQHGYKVRTIQPFDMFPHTMHVETICLLVLRNPVTHVNIDVDVEELVQDKRGQATYEQIRDYVMEQTGLHVTNLNIAQTKRKCGIIERENYNLPKSEDSKQPNCTKEKEKAIKEAFKHFGMI